MPRGKRARPRAARGRPAEPRRSNAPAADPNEWVFVPVPAIGVVLTVASGPVSKAANTALVSRIAAPSTKQAIATAKPIVLSSGLRYKIGEDAKPVLVAGLQRAGGHPNAIIERAWERNSIGASHTAPVFPPWNRIPEKLSQAPRATSVRSMPQTSAASRNWGGMTQTQSVSIRPTFARWLATATNRSPMAARILPARMPMSMPMSMPMIRPGR
jgi:hypothetical protein